MKRRTLGALLVLYVTIVTAPLAGEYSVFRGSGTRTSDAATTAAVLPFPQCLQ